jgi:hypothetical protein
MNVLPARKTEKQSIVISIKVRNYETKKHLQPYIAFFGFDRQGLPPKWPDITAIDAHKPDPFWRPQPNYEAPRGE